MFLEMSAPKFLFSPIRFELASVESEEIQRRRRQFSEFLGAYLIFLARRNVYREDCAIKN